VDTSKEVKSLRSTCEKTKERLREKEQELAAAQAENQTLRLQVILHICKSSLCTLAILNFFTHTHMSKDMKAFFPTHPKRLVTQLM